MLTAVCISLNRTTELGVLQVAASQYLAALIIGFVNSATVQPVIAIERTVFHREKAAGTHLLLSYAGSTFSRIQNVPVDDYRAYHACSIGAQPCISCRHVCQLPICAGSGRCGAALYCSSDCHLVPDHLFHDGLRAPSRSETSPCSHFITVFQAMRYLLSC